MDMRDLRVAFRSLGRRPTYTIAAILTLALGIGATTAVFSVIYSVILRPLAFENPDELVRVYAARGRRGTSTPSNFVDLQQQNRSFEAMTAWYESAYAVSGDGGDAEQIDGAAVTPQFFDVLRAQPHRGRGFLSTEGAAGTDKVVVLSHELWVRRFGAEPSIIGRSVRMDGEPRTVVGVMRRGFRYPGNAELWVPLAFSGEELATQRGAHYLDVLGRLKPGISMESANADLGVIWRRLEEMYPDKNRGWRIELLSLHESIVGDVKPALRILFLAAVLVLLIACVNVANLTLSQGLARSRDLAIRAAIGARRGRIIRELGTECGIVALAGAAIGVLIAVASIEVLTAIPSKPIPRIDEVTIGVPMLLFSLAASMLAAVIFGLLPALHVAASSRLSERLKEGGRGTAGARSERRLRSLLVICEVSLAVMLLTASGLLLKSFARLQSVEPGFGIERILTFTLSFPSTRYAEPSQVSAVTTRILDSVRTVPGVEKSGAVFGLPLSGLTYGISLTRKDGVELPSDENTPSSQVRIVSPDYFSALGIPLLRGRLLSDSDTRESPRVILINETAAKHLWPGQDPIGRSLELGTRFGMEDRIRGTVVGIVGDVRHRGFTEPPMTETYFPYRQAPSDFLSVVVRTSGDPNAVIQPIRARLRGIDPELPMFQVRTMEQLADEAVAPAKLYMTLILIFGAIAVTLAIVGIYGVVAF